MRNWQKDFVSPAQNNDNRTGSVGSHGFGKSVDNLRSSKAAAIAVPPRGVPLPQNFTEKYSLQEVIAKWDPAVATAAPADDTVHALVYTPSNRLIVTVQAIIEPDNIVASDPVFTNQPTWNIRRMAINSISGRETPMSQFYPDTGDADFPDEVIIENAPELMRVNFNDFNTLQFDTAPYQGTIVNLILQVKWEPDVETIPPAELKRLYSRCRINYGVPLVMQNAAIP